MNDDAEKRASAWVTSKVIDSGEASAISLAIQAKADWLLTDDARARQFAESLGLETHGTIGIVLWNLAVGNINANQAHLLMDALGGSSLWVSQRVMNEARQAIERLSAL